MVRYLKLYSNNSIISSPADIGRGYLEQYNVVHLIFILNINIVYQQYLSILVLNMTINCSLRMCYFVARTTNYTKSSYAHRSIYLILRYPYGTTRISTENRRSAQWLYCCWYSTQRLRVICTSQSTNREVIPGFRS